jgi:hypothetical protein
MKTTNEIISENLQYYMDKFSINNKELSEIVGVSESTVGKWILKKATPRMGVIEKLADYFNIQKSNLLEEKKEENHNTIDLTKYDNIFPVTKKKIPLLGEIACGEPIFANEDRESYIEVGTDIKADFCLKCKGDSMINVRINPGDIVFIKKQSIVENGEIAAVIIEDTATLKRVFYHKNNIIELRAENPKYQSMIYTNEELEKINILGKAIAFQSDVL